MDRLLTSPSGPPRRMAELDLLRCLAILMVVTLHAAAPLLSDPSLLGTPAWYFCLLLDPFSRTGVPIFFMLSGFLLLRDPRTLQVGPFYRRRLPRLAVPLVLWNLIYALADAWSARRPFSPLEYLEGLLDRGCYYHIWFIYLLVGLYLLAPFLKRIVDHASGREVLVLPAGLAAGEPAAPPHSAPSDLSGRRAGLGLGRVGQLGLRLSGGGPPPLCQRLPPEPLPVRRRPVRLAPGPL